MQNTAELLKQIYSLAENESVLFTVNNVKFQSNLDLSQIAYKDNVTGIDTLSEIGLNGIPILICESTRIESVDPFSKNTNDEFAYGCELALYQTYTATSICRVEFYNLPNPNDAMIPSKHYYARWTYAQDELPKIAKSNKTSKEKMQAYREFGVFAVPYVVKEIEKGHTEFEDFFILIGAHLSTPDYLKIVERTSLEQPPPKMEEINEALFKYAEDFNYKVWLSENEEDLDNLFKFLDAYCAEYEAENKS